MISSREFRVGNLVSSHVNERQKEYLSDEYLYVITEIKALKVNANIVEHGGMNIYKSTHLPYDKINLIPLAEEWLLKLGFSEKKLIAAPKVKSNIEYRLLLPSSTDRTGIPMLPAFLNLQKRNDFLTMQYGNFFLELRFVHQLQNLYFALTGNELTLTPAKEMK